MDFGLAAGEGLGGGTEKTKNKKNQTSIQNTITSSNIIVHMLKQYLSNTISTIKKIWYKDLF